MLPLVRHAFEEPSLLEGSLAAFSSLLTRSGPSSGRVSTVRSDSRSAPARAPGATGRPRPSPASSTLRRSTRSPRTAARPPTSSQRQNRSCRWPGRPRRASKRRRDPRPERAAENRHPHPRRPDPRCEPTPWASRPRRGDAALRCPDRSTQALLRSGPPGVEHPQRDTDEQRAGEPPEDVDHALHAGDARARINRRGSHQYPA